ncbi:MAG: hypothetical protein WBD48_12660, partial [Pseudolabrys sp.]
AHAVDNQLVHENLATGSRIGFAAHGLPRSCPVHRYPLSAVGVQTSAIMGCMREPTVTVAEFRRP